MLSTDKVPILLAMCKNPKIRGEFAIALIGCLGGSFQKIRFMRENQGIF
ncbi:hypothetical protein [Rhizobium sp.]